MAKRGSENVSVQRQATTNSDGDKVPGEMVGVLKRCLIIPRASSEDWV